MMFERIIASYLIVGLLTGLFVFYYLFFTENGKNEALVKISEQLFQQNRIGCISDKRVFNLILGATKILMAVRYVVFWPEFIYLNAIKKVTKKD